MSNELYLTAMREKGLADAADLQGRAATMDGTAIYAEEEKIPDFAAAVKAKNMLERPVGFLCRSSAGRVVKLLQVYDSTVYTQEPEDLPAQWGFYWSTDPAKALPFVAISTSPYMIGDCCTEGGRPGALPSTTTCGPPADIPRGGTRSAPRTLPSRRSQRRSRKIRRRPTRNGCSLKVPMMPITSETG